MNFDFRKEEKKLFFGFRTNLIIIVIALAVILAFYFFFLRSNVCPDYQCFQDALLKCRKTEFVKEDDESIWKYSLQGNADGDACRISVTLVTLKEGKIDLEYLQGKSMNCIMMKSASGFPENDLINCTGELKEGIQEVMIQRMHNYLIKNIGELREDFQKI